MPEPLNNRRVRFPPGCQREFLLSSARMLGLTNSGMANLLTVNIRTLTDWKRERFLMSEEALKVIINNTMQDWPSNVEVCEPYWYTIKGGVAGGRAKYQKYGNVGGNEELRKARWNDWWTREGKYRSSLKTVPTPIAIPVKDKDLAEFVGILLGDGAITSYQVCITLHHVDDREYSVFIQNLIQKLFGVKPSVYKSSKDASSGIVISRKLLVDYLTHDLGLKVGSKVRQQVDVPDWIKQDREWYKACIRGLVDTDGSIVIHRYKVGGKYYTYKKLCFASMSSPLRVSIYNGLKDLGLSPRLAKNGRDIYLDSQQSVSSYFKIVGSHNAKHLTRFYG